MSEFSHGIDLPSLTVPSDWFNVQDSTPTTTSETGAPQSIDAGGADSTILIVGGLVVVVVLFIVIAWVMRKGPDDKTGDRRDGGTTRSPSTDVLSDRRVVDKPSEIAAGDSLAEVRAKKREKVAVTDYEEAKKQLQARKAGSSHQQAHKPPQEAASQQPEEATPQQPEAEPSDASPNTSQEDPSAEAAETEQPEPEDAGILGALDEGWGSVDFDGFALGSGSEQDFGGIATAVAEAAEAEAEPDEVGEDDETPEPAQVEESDDSADSDAPAEPVTPDASADVPAEPVTPDASAEPVTPDAPAEPVDLPNDLAEAPQEASGQTEPAAETVAQGDADRRSLKDGLKKTRGGFVHKLGSLLKKKTKLDEDLLDEVEEVLYTADIGPKTVQVLLDRFEAEGDATLESAWQFIREETLSILSRNQRPLDLSREDGPFVILVVGVNGVGKTTTIGKLATRFTDEGKKVLMVAGDTFRAAATEQLEQWGTRTGLPVHSAEGGADPASVVFDGIQRGISEGCDVVICDTAGRLTNKKNLMQELEKIARVSGKAMPSAPHETLLVLDANTGLMAIQQAEMFQEVVEITGIVLTKLDGTAKGGVVIGICKELEVPVRYIGIGEGVYDLRTFDAEEFVEALYL